MPRHEDKTDLELILELTELDEEMADNDKRMSDWDLEFTESIISNPSDELSPKQRDIVIRILRKY